MYLNIYYYIYINLYMLYRTYNFIHNKYIQLYIFKYISENNCLIYKVYNLQY